MADRVSSLRDEQIQNNAVWAQRFIGTAENQGSPRSEYERLQQDQNDSRRRLYKNEIDDAIARDKARTAEEFEALQIRNPAVGRLMLDRQKEQRMEDENRMKRSLEERKFAWTQEKDRIGNEINRKRQELQLKQEQRLLNKEQRALDDADRIESQTMAVEDGEAEMRSFGLLPGTEGYAAGLASLLKDNPYIDNGYRKLLLDQAFIEVDPADFQAALARGDKVVRTQDAEGRTKYSITAAPEKPATTSNADLYRDRSFATARADRLEKEIIGYPKDKQGSEEYKRAVEQRDAFRKRAEEADAKIRAGGQPKQEATVAPVSEQPSVQTPAQKPGAKLMRAPDGQVRMVDPDSFEKYKSKGATFVD